MRLLNLLSGVRVERAAFPCRAAVSRREVESFPLPAKLFSVPFDNAPALSLLVNQLFQLGTPVCVSRSFRLDRFPSTMIVSGRVSIRG